MYKLLNLSLVKITVYTRSKYRFFLGGDNVHCHIQDSMIESIYGPD